MDFLNLQESSDDEDIINYIEQLGRNRRPKIIRNRPNNFNLWDDHDFFVRYRLSKNTVRHLINEISEFIAHPTDWNSALTAEQMVLLTLRFYATGSFLSTVGDLTGVHKSTASGVVRKVSDAIASMRHQYIHLPTLNEDKHEVNQGFYDIAHFPRVIGAIDCTHIKIQSPGGEEAEIYRNRKGYFSFNVQTICDHKLKIRDIVCRWPGSTHDSHIFNNSYVREKFERRELGNDYLLLGDSGYRNRNYLLTPLLNPVTRAEQLYNESHIRTRNCVERQYGVWKRRFPVLSTGIRLKLLSVESIVVATAVLHNIACDANEDIPPVDIEVEAAINDFNDLQGIENVQNLAQDDRTRHHLITNYFHNLAHQ